MTSRAHIILLIVFLSLCSMGTVYSQDYIYLMNGNAIKADIRSVVGRHIVYTPYNEEVEQSLRISKDEVSRIKRANGTEVWYNQLPGTEPEKKPAAPSAPKMAVASTNKRPISAQKLQRRKILLAHTTHFLLSGGLALPYEDFNSFDPGIALQLSLTHYFNDHWGLSTQIATTYHDQQATESGQAAGALSNTSFMVGGKLSTSFPLSLIRIYGQALTGPNFAKPSAEFSKESTALGLGYSLGAGMIYDECFHLGISYQRTHQDLELLSPKHPTVASYLSLVIGVHF